MQLGAAAPPSARSEGSAAHSAVAVKGSYFSADLTEKEKRPRKTRTLLSLCINQIGEFCALLEPGADESHVEWTSRVFAPISGIY